MKHLLNHLSTQTPKEDGSVKFVNHFWRKRDTFLLLAIFIFCMISSVIAINTFPILKKSGIHQLTQDTPVDYTDVSLFAELNEEDSIDFEFIGFYLLLLVTENTGLI